MGSGAAFTVLQGVVDDDKNLQPTLNTGVVPATVFDSYQLVGHGIAHGIMPKCAILR